MVENFVGLMIWKNFMRSIFTKKHKRDPKTNKESPAMRLGLEKKILSFQEFFKFRLQKTQIKLNPDWSGFVDRIDQSSRRPIRPY